VPTALRVVRARDSRSVNAVTELPSGQECGGRIAYRRIPLAGPQSSLPTAAAERPRASLLAPVLESDTTAVSGRFRCCGLPAYKIARTLSIALEIAPERSPSATTTPSASTARTTPYSAIV
jgi:hypothetical protein